MKGEGNGSTARQRIAATSHKRGRGAVLRPLCTLHRITKKKPQYPIRAIEPSARFPFYYLTKQSSPSSFLPALVADDTKEEEKADWDGEHKEGGGRVPLLLLS